MTSEQHDMLQNPEDFSAVREFFTSERKDGMKTIEELAQEAGASIEAEWGTGGLSSGMYMEFAVEVSKVVAALVRAQAMEEAAVICEDGECGQTEYRCSTIENIASAIRAAAQEVKPTAPASSSAG